MRSLALPILALAAALVPAGAIGAGAEEAPARVPVLYATDLLHPHDDPDDHFDLACLYARPLPGTRLCVLGRETALRRVEWNGAGWLRVAGGGHHPVLREVAPALPPHPFPAPPARIGFDGPALDVRLVTPREPPDESWLSLSARPGWLRLRGRESLNSTFDPSLVARRLPSVRCEAVTRVEFRPGDEQQMAGLVLFYDHRNYRWLRVSRDAEIDANVAVLSLARGRMAISAPVPIDAAAPCFLRARIEGAKLAFHHSADGRTWRRIGADLDLGELSDDHCRGFTGTVVGLAVQDASGARIPADFDFLEVRERP